MISTVPSALPHAAFEPKAERFETDVDAGCRSPMTLIKHELDEPMLTINSPRPPTVPIEAQRSTTTYQGAEISSLRSTAYTSNNPSQDVLLLNHSSTHNASVANATSRQYVSESPLTPPTDNESVAVGNANFAANYQLPSVLPKAPSLKPRSDSTAAVSPSPMAMPDTPSTSAIDTFPENYLTMNGSAQSAGQSSMEQLDALLTIIKESPIMQDLDSFPTSPNMGANMSIPFMTSPFLDYQDYDPNAPVVPDVSPSIYDQDTFSPQLFDADSFDAAPGLIPDTTPYTADMSFLTTPQSSDIHDVPVVTGESEWTGSLFPEYEAGGHMAALASPAPVSEPVVAPKPSKPAASSKKPRKSSATGTRKNVTPDTLLDVNAPIQTRKYALPSSTSRKEVPVTFQRKRKRAQAFDDDDEDEEELGELPPNATEKQQIEFKRKQNTIAARKSRKRKLEHQRNLEDSVDRLNREKDMWETRARTLLGIMKARGQSVPQWGDEI